MTLREALAWAIDHMRTDHPDDDQARKCAKVREQKLTRLRARSEAPAFWPHRCYCGERKEPRALVCGDCYRVVPAKLMWELQLGKPRERKRARSKISVLCETRVALEEAQNAA